MEKNNTGFYFWILERGNEFVTSFDSAKEAEDYRKEFLTADWAVVRKYSDETGVR